MDCIVFSNGLVQVSDLLYMIKHTHAIGGNMDPKGHMWVQLSVTRRNVDPLKGPCPVAWSARTLSKLSESTESACQGQHAVYVDMGVA